jgi:pimeloyl-ACP methyl ester carboxylesterase
LASRGTDTNERQIFAHPGGDAPVAAARESTVALPAGSFRYLEWPGVNPPVVLLHGLSGVADVWYPLVNALGPNRPRLLAFDQRGHGQTHPADREYGIGAFVADTLAFFDQLGLEKPHLVGHSMGARVAMVVAARHPGRIRSVAIVDIGPEAWKANWQESIAAFESMPKEFADEDAALTFASRGRDLSTEARFTFLSRLRRTDAGTLAWRADTAALDATVRAHRSRNFWADWERVQPPAFLIRGGTSKELRPRVYEEMRRRNPHVEVAEIEGVGHNIPLIAPAKLAGLLTEFWAR